MRKNWLGESKKSELERRVEALEVHLKELEGRITRNAYLHAREFHKGQEGMILPPQEG